MIKKIVIVVELVCIFLLSNTVKIHGDIETAPFKNSESAKIEIPKHNSMVEKVNTLHNYRTISRLDKFLLHKIETVNETIQSNFSSGKYQLPSLSSVWDVANYLVGRGGTCFYIAQLFIDIYRGSDHRIANAYVVTDPVPGDVIYYANGGIGYEHWAIYLGENTALQGNYLGTTIIGSVYLNNASDPVFYRVP